MGVEGYVVADPFFGRPFIDRDEWLETPVRHRFVHGGFEGTATRFSFAFPPPESFRGRFLQPLNGGPGGVEYNPEALDVAGAIFISPRWAFDLGGYMVDTNQGHIGSELCPKAGEDASVYGFRASAESARLARHLASEFYGHVPHHGYVYGASGGFKRGVNCLENVDDVWDGALIFNGTGCYGSVMPIEEFDPTQPATMYGIQNFSAMFNALRLLGPDKVAGVVDATDPGGGGDPFTGLDTDQRRALADLYRIGYPRGSEFALSMPMGQIGQWSWCAEMAIAQDPEYFEFFWSEPGYVGHDAPHLLRDDLLESKTTVAGVVTAGELAATLAGGWPPGASPMASLALRLPPQRPVGIVVAATGSGYLLGASIKFLSGRAEGRQLWSTGSVGEVILADGIGPAGNLKYDGVQVGDEVELDNRHFLAYCHWYRHCIEAQMPEHDFLRTDGRPIYPQRPMRFLRGPLFGPMFTARPKIKVLHAAATNDTSAWPFGGYQYQQLVRGALGRQADDVLRLRWIDKSEHVPGSLLPDSGSAAPGARMIEYQGAIEQSLHDLVAWVEDGIVPENQPYSYTADHRIELGDDPATRGGIQAVVRATVNGGVRADVEAGAEVTLGVDTAVPPGAGTIVDVEWDFDGRATWTHRQPGIDGTATTLTRAITHRYDTPGTYFPAVRVTTHRDGLVDTTSRRVQNLDRVRVVVR
jgi:hypothetical protein